MKQSTITLLLSLLIIILAACSSNTPQSVAVEFYKAYYSANLKKVKSLCTSDTQEGIDMLISMAEKKELEDIEKTNAKFEVIDCEIDKDGITARVTLKIIEKDKEYEHKVRLKKEDGQWLVVFKIK